MVFQDLDNIPEGFTRNPERTKPWGTGHAVLMGKDVINEPFAVINADDYYGRESFEILAQALRDMEGKKGEYCMIGFRIENTLSENGGVSRGLCEVSADGNLTGVTECHGIERKGDKLIHVLNGEEKEFPAGANVSMNMWGFTPDYFGYSEKAFVKFLSKYAGELKGEFYIPTVVNDLIEANEITLAVKETPSKWFGVTYAADREDTVNQFKKLVEEGVYPSPLF